MIYGLSFFPPLPYPILVVVGFEQFVFPCFRTPALTTAPRRLPPVATAQHLYLSYPRFSAVPLCHETATVAYGGYLTTCSPRETVDSPFLVLTTSPFYHFTS